MGERIGMDIVNMIWDRCVNAIEAPTYEAVSYTHLDVYKRQLHNIATRWIGKDNPYLPCIPPCYTLHSSKATIPDS